MSDIFNRVGIRLEVAQDVLGAIIAHYAAEIGKELAKPNPDVSVIEAAERVQDEMDELRDSLRADISNRRHGCRQFTVLIEINGILLGKGGNGHTEQGSSQQA